MRKSKIANFKFIFLSDSSVLFGSNKRQHQVKVPNEHISRLRWIPVEYPRHHSWKTLGDRSPLLESWKFLEAQSALTFNLLDSYSAVIMISLNNSNSKTFLEMASISLFCVPPIFIRYERSLILLTWKWIDLRFNIFQKVKRASLMASNYRKLIWRFDSCRDDSPFDTF